MPPVTEPSAAPLRHIRWSHGRDQVQLWRRQSAPGGIPPGAFSQCRRRDLNPRPSIYETDALPLSYYGGPGTRPSVRGREASPERQGSTRRRGGSSPRFRRPRSHPKDRHRVVHCHVPADLWKAGDIAQGISAAHFRNCAAQRHSCSSHRPKIDHVDGNECLPSQQFQRRVTFKRQNKLTNRTRY